MLKTDLVGRLDIPIVVDIMSVRFRKNNPNKISGIYKISSPNNKAYIGLSKNIENRFIVYKNLRCKTQSLLYRSLLKYGLDSHIFEIIHVCEESELEEWELYYGELFDVTSRKTGLNLKKCGSKMPTFTYETKKKMSESHKGSKSYNYGIKMTDERKKIQSEKMSGKNNPNYGRKVSDEQKVKLSKLHKGKNNPFYGKKHTEETINLLKNKKHSTETKNKMSDDRKGEKGYFYGKKHTEENKKKISERAKERIGNLSPMYGKKHTKETKDRISESKKGKMTGSQHYNYGKVMDENIRSKISKTLKEKKWDKHPNKGLVRSEETRSKISKARTGKYTKEENGFFGKKHTEETKQKIREKALERNKINKENNLKNKSDGKN